MKRYRLCTTNELNIEKTFECGQCFRWDRNGDGAYTGIAMGYPARVETIDDKVYITSNAPDELWREYFDMDTDYAAASESFTGEYLERCKSFGRGIRILRQEPWEALCSFIISQCNNITRIKGIVDRLCTKFGEETVFEGRTYYSFPSADILADLTVNDLAPLRCGYRAEYIIKAAKAVRDGEIDLAALCDCDYRLAIKELRSLYGVGEKVANCVVLFGLGHMEAFPVDVWMKRALKEHFPPNFDPKTLGEYAGLAQQYIFYYARSGED